MEKQLVTVKAKEFEIDSNQPFKDDKLGRKEYAEILTGIVEAMVGGAVIALNGSWGTGKTTFLRMWKSYLENQKFKVVYYNAWEDDICDEPLMSMLRGMKELQEGEMLDNLFRIGAKVFVGALSGALVAATGIFGKIAEGAVEGGMNQLENSVYESLKEDDDRMKLMRSFKESLSDYMTTVCDKGKPLVFMVDELDRCNPSFAVKVLERIKHLFDVPGIVFVLAIDKKQLACSVKGFYGSNEIDAEEYLRRFIDYDYYLPEPNAEQFCDYLYDYFGLDDFLKNEWRIGFDYSGQKKAKAQKDKDNLLYMAKTLVKQKHLSLRQTERIFSTARIGLCGTPFNTLLFPELFFFLSYLKICEPKVFEKIACFDLDLQEFVDSMEQIIVPGKLSPYAEEKDLFSYLIAIALRCYYCGYRVFISNTKRQGVNLFDHDKLLVDLKTFEQPMVHDILNSYQGSDISDYTNRLKLLEKLVGLPQTYGEIKVAN